MITQRLLLLLASAATVFALSGCETTSTGPKKSADSGEYEYVTPLGSNIPVRVKKGTTAANKEAPSETMTAEQAANMIQRAGASTPDRGR